MKLFDFIASALSNMEEQKNFAFLQSKYNCSNLSAMLEEIKERASKCEDEKMLREYYKHAKFVCALYDKRLRERKLRNEKLSNMRADINKLRFSNL